MCGGKNQELFLDDHLPCDNKVIAAATQPVYNKRAVANNHIWRGEYESWRQAACHGVIVLRRAFDQVDGRRRLTPMAVPCPELRLLLTIEYRDFRSQSRSDR